MDPAEIAELITEDPDVIAEARKPLMRFLKTNLPNVPDYVLKDFFYQMLKDASKKEMHEALENYSHYKWVLKKDFPISLDIFDESTIKRLKERKGGSENPYQVPRDEERHEKQKELIAQKGLPTEPIILIQDGDKFELVEGWHRTIQLLNLFPKGYKYPNVYIGTQ